MVSWRQSLYHPKVLQLVFAKNSSQRLDKDTKYLHLPVAGMCSTVLVFSRIHPTRTGCSTWENQEQRTALWIFLIWDSQTVETTCFTSSPTIQHRRCQSREAYSYWWQVGIFHLLLQLIIMTITITIITTIRNRSMTITVISEWIIISIVTKCLKNWNVKQHLIKWQQLH